MATEIQQAIDLLRANQVGQAEAILSQLIRANPYHAHAMNLLGIVFIKKRDTSTALHWLEKAIALDPERAEYHHNIGPVFRIQGDFEKAEEHYRRAIALKPDYAECYFNFSAIRTFSAGDPMFQELEALLTRPDLNEQDRCFGHFAAGKIHDDIEDFDAAFRHYQAGNEARGVTFDMAAQRRYVAEYIEVFSESMLQRRRHEGMEDPTPVFVIGMPRSGTTLVEQILSSHPDVYGAGEISDIIAIAGTLPQYASDGSAYPRCVTELGPEVMRGFGEAYLKRIRTLDGEAQRIVNKMPQNFLFAGLIALLLPNARIIHCRRDPLDTCLSCYFQRFRERHEYSYDLCHLGQYYRQYQQLMDHWRGSLPLPMLEVDYEAVVEDQERETRRLIEFLDLPWNDQCLEFHRSERPVTTASSFQVRQPIYRSSLKRWQRYAKHLGPLRDALGDLS